MFKKEKIFAGILLILMIFILECSGTPKSSLNEKNEGTEIQKEVEETKKVEPREVVIVENEWEEMPVYSSGIFKAYMDGCAITDTSSAAWAQLQKMWIDENGCYREGEYVGIAMAQAYGTIGDKFRITLSSGQVFYGVMADLKQWQHVDESYADANGGILEFVVDIGTLREDARIAGSLDCIYEGSVVKLERLK